jgi:hypothetical protein
MSFFQMYDIKSRQQALGGAALQRDPTITALSLRRRERKQGHFRQREEQMLLQSFGFKSYPIRNAFPDYNINVIYIS